MRSLMHCSLEAFLPPGVWCSCCHFCYYCVIFIIIWLRLSYCVCMWCKNLCSLFLTHKQANIIQCFPVISSSLRPLHLITKSFYAFHLTSSLPSIPPPPALPSISPTASSHLSFSPFLPLLFLLFKPYALSFLISFDSHILIVSALYLRFVVCSSSCSSSGSNHLVIVRVKYILNTISLCHL